MILGVGSLFCFISGAALIAELGHLKERAVLTLLFISSYFIGQILARHCFRNYRHPQQLGLTYPFALHLPVAATYLHTTKTKRY